MSKSILMHENGGPEKMQLADVDVGDPGRPLLGHGVAEEADDVRRHDFRLGAKWV